MRATLRRVPGISGPRSIAVLNEVADAMRARLELSERPPDPLVFLRDLLTMAERYSRAAD
jgi:hypothetical protein